MQILVGEPRKCKDDAMGEVEYFVLPKVSRGHRVLGS